VVSVLDTLFVVPRVVSLGDKQVSGQGRTTIRYLGKIFPCHLIGWIDLSQPH
jgi:hypothetical protein